MTTQLSLFNPRQTGNLSFEEPVQNMQQLVVGRITQLTHTSPAIDTGVKSAACQDDPGQHKSKQEKGTQSMHAGSIKTSSRLQDTLAVLRDGQWHTTRQIRMVTDSEAVHSDMAALAANGIKYECKPCGEKKYAYRLISMEKNT